MLESILNEQLFNIINYKISNQDLNEIRIRANKPIVVFMKGQPYYICEKGLTCNVNNAIFASKDMISDIVFRASDFSIYSVNEQIKNGFIVLENGVRIGLCGSFVSDAGELKTINNWTSLNIRIPHQIKNASLNVFSQIVNENGIKNTLIISPPCAGKTTFIRDVVLQMSLHNFCSNVVIVDERGEIAGGDKSGLELGNFCDVISFSTKQQGFMQAIRTLSPNLIVTDELGNEEDAESLIDAINSGVKVIATIHGANLEDIKKRKIFLRLPMGYFERFVVLSTRNGPGTIEGVYNEKLSRICEW